MTDEIEIDDTQPGVTPEIEERFRDLILAYCDICHNGATDKEEAFARGLVWGAVNFLEVMGYKDWALSIIDSELADFSRKIRGDGGFFSYLGQKGFDAKSRRILIPGNRWESLLGR